MKNEIYHAIHHMSYRDGSPEDDRYVCYSTDIELLKKILEEKIKKNVIHDMSCNNMAEGTYIVETTKTSFIYENDRWRYEYSISENVKLRIVEESDLLNEDFMDNHIFFDVCEWEEF